MSTLGDLADRVRDLPLDDVLKSYGFELRREGLSWRAKTDRYNIVIRGPRWFDNKTGIGGGGAVDLAKYLTGASFAQAVKDLAERFTLSVCRNISSHKRVPPAPQSAPEEQRENFEELLKRLGKRDDFQWKIARQYLVERRAIDSRLVDQLYEEGKIYANSHQPNPSVVFLHTDPKGRIKGATLRDTKHQSSFRPCLGDKKNAWFTVGNLSEAQSIAITEAPSDALSYRCLSKHSGRSIAAVSVSGTHVSDELLKYIRTHKKNLILAFDNDCAGERAAERLIACIRSTDGVSRKRPHLKDWNEDLCFIKQTQHLLREHQTIPKISL